MGAIGLASVPAQAARPRSTVDQIYRVLHVADIPAAYVILVDTSASMQSDGMYPQVKHYLKRFDETLPKQDQVHYFTFAASVGGPFPNAAGLPSTARVNGTDFGPALADARHAERRGG